MKKTTLYAPNGRKVYVRMNDERTVYISMRQISYLLAGLCGYDHCLRIGNPDGPCVNVGGYYGGYSAWKHAYQIEETNGFKWIMIPGPRRPRRKVMA